MNVRAADEIRAGGTGLQTQTRGGDGLSRFSASKIVIRLQELSMTNAKTQHHRQ